MKPLTLDAGNYTGTYKLIGGRVSLDLVNTVSWPHTDQRHDWLTTQSNVAAWLEAVGLPTHPMVGRDLTVLHEVRSVLAEMLGPLAHGDHPRVAACERFNLHLARALARRCIDPNNLDWGWEPTKGLFDILSPVILDAAHLITEGDHTRLKHCPSCDWVFEDQTRNGRRRWCDMTDCGSRAKARSYYRRTKGLPEHE